MTTAATGLLPRDMRTDWVRMRTLILLRWMAVAGQATAILVAVLVFRIDLPFGASLVVVGVSVLANLISTQVFPANKRLSETEALLTLLFDLSQLALLVLLTGGLSNPFALLMLAPVTISASAFELRTTVVLGVFAIAAMTLVAFVNLPLRFEDGTALEIPQIFKFGFWLSIVVGIIFLSLYARRVASEIRSMSQALLATQMALAREQKLTDLGGVVAAAAHELGTPLATIKLVSSEMISDLADRPDLLEDMRLIRDQADRCRDILRSMGRAGKDDLHLRQAPLDAVLHEAAEPHLDRGKQLEFSIKSEAPGLDPQPEILRRPEVIHGLRNLIQNAVDFANSVVWIDASWSEAAIQVRISDDGAGFPAHIIGRIGDPFVRARTAEREPATRPEYEGMGLGLFIAKTLLERTGAQLTFANRSDSSAAPDQNPLQRGAVVTVLWPRESAISGAGFTPGDNVPFLP